MVPTHGELMRELMKLSLTDSARFKKFWNEVMNKVIHIPAGGKLIISDHCNPASIEIFKKIAMVYIIEYNFDKKIYDDYYEFSDDYGVIYHVGEFIPSVPLSSKFRAWNPNITT